MKQKTNGKIVVAILVMFAVAISIIGFTYAYFTATFNTNNQDKSVTVTAGKLMANFTGTNAINVSNIVPGWLSNGLSYYDSNLALANGGKIFATELTLTAPEGQDPTYTDYYGAGVSSDVKWAYEQKGLTQPIQFSVANDENSPDAVSFIIRLTEIENGIKTAADSESDETKKAKLTADLENLKVHLYEGTFNYAERNNGTTPYGGTKVSTLQFANSGTQILSTAPHTIAKGGAAKNFFIIFEYENEESIEQYAQGVTIKARADIIGIQKGSTPETQSNWYDADNGLVTFATSE